MKNIDYFYIAIMDAALTTGAILSKNGKLMENLYAVVVDTTETEFEVK